MQTVNTSVNALKKLMKLAQSKDKLQSQLAAVNNEMAGLLKELSLDAPTSAKKPAVSAKPAKAAKAAKPVKRRGNLTASIIAVLEAAGAEGASVQHIAKQVGTKGGNIHAWLASTGKSRIERVGRGCYRLIQQQPQQQQQQNH